MLYERAAQLGQGAAPSPIDVRTQVWYNPDLVSAYYMIPGMIGMILQFLTLRSRPAPSSASASGARSSNLPSRRSARSSW